MTKIYPDRHGSYDAKPLTIGKASMLTVLVFIILFVVGSLLISGYFRQAEITTRRSVMKICGRNRK